jgi:hypothetical protein
LITIEEEREDQPSVLQFPIQGIDDEIRMKNIAPYDLPHFHGITTKDLDTFIFEFEVLYRTYECIAYAQKLELFPSTLKELTLIWFVSLEGNDIRNWDQMKRAFIEKYRDYCKSMDTKDEIF